ncbi:MAG TPA: hypothetical protein VFD43_12810, partial [Planctomycetota bacterium]|nr:hypothetical protein [Planctomycetota bacterium]
DELDGSRDPVLLAIGGSTTECLVLDQGEAWPARLQDELSSGGRKAWVGNAGRSGHGTREHVVQVPVLLEELPAVEVLLVLAGSNDLGLRLGQDEDYDPGFLLAEDFESQQIPRAFSEYPRELAAGLPFYKRTELYARARLLKNLLAGRLGLSADQGRRGEGVTRWRENRRQASAIRERLPDLQASLAEYRRNLGRIVESASQRGVTVVLLTQPTIWRADLGQAERGRLWWGGVGDFQASGARVPFYSVEALAEGCAAYNRALLETAQSTGALGFDLAAEIPKTAEMFYDDMHFTEAGASRVAQAVAAFLRERAVFDG